MELEICWKMKVSRDHLKWENPDAERQTWLLLSPIVIDESLLSNWWKEMERSTAKNYLDLRESYRKENGKNFWNQRGQENHKKTQRINKPRLTGIQRLDSQPGKLHGIDLGTLHIYCSCSCWNPILRAGTISDSITCFGNSFLLLNCLLQL